MDAPANTKSIETLHVWVLYEDATTFARSVEFTEALEEEMEEGLTLDATFHLIGSLDAFGERLRLHALMGTIDLLVMAVHVGDSLPPELHALNDMLWFPRERAPLGLIGLVGSSSCDHGNYAPQHHHLRDLAKSWGVAYLPEGMADSPLSTPGHAGASSRSVLFHSLPFEEPNHRDWGIND